MTAFYKSNAEPFSGHTFLPINNKRIPAKTLKGIEFYPTLTMVKVGKI